MSMENKEGPEKFSFLQEVIKEKPLNRKKLMHKAAGLAAAGILFGAFASISFCVFQPWVDEQLNAEEEITIPKDEEPEEHPQEAKAEEEEREPELTLENFEELERAMYQVAAEANKSIVSVDRGRAKRRNRCMWRDHAVQQQRISDPDDGKCHQGCRADSGDIWRWRIL